jgi:hypothetical protein
LPGNIMIGNSTPTIRKDCAVATRRPTTRDARRATSAAVARCCPMPVCSGVSRARPCRSVAGRGPADRLDSATTSPVAPSRGSRAGSRPNGAVSTARCGGRRRGRRRAGRSGGARARAGGRHVRDGPRGRRLIELGDVLVGRVRQAAQVFHDPRRSVGSPNEEAAQDGVCWTVTCGSGV